MMFGKSEGGGRRQAPRTAAPLNAVVDMIGQSRCFELVDISTSGARLSGTPLPRIGTEVTVSVETVQAFGIIVWSEHGQCGVEFDHGLDAQAVRAIRHQVLRAAGMRPGLKAAMDDWTMGMAR
jgi:hypothetical protein